MEEARDEAKLSVRDTDTGGILPSGLAACGDLEVFKWNLALGFACEGGLKGFQIVALLVAEVRTILGLFECALCARVVYSSKLNFTFFSASYP